MKARRGGPAGARGRALAWAAAATVLALSPGRAFARLYVTRDQALRQVFGKDAEIRPRTLFLEPREVEAVRKRARAPFEARRVTYYVASRGDSVLGTAWLDTHRVRTLDETVLVEVTPEGSAGAVEVLSFSEPGDYLPSARWLGRVRGGTLGDDLRPGEAVPNLSGATLTARAITDAVRRALALHELARGRVGAGEGRRPSRGGGGR